MFMSLAVAALVTMIALLPAFLVVARLVPVLGVLLEPSFLVFLAVFLSSLRNKIKLISQMAGQTGKATMIRRIVVGEITDKLLVLMRTISRQIKINIV